MYTCSYEVEDKTFEQNVEIEFTFGLNADKKILVHCERVDGDQLYYKKVLGELKTRCLI